MDIRIDVRNDLKRVTASLSAFAEKQIPFAMAVGLNAIGKTVVVAEKAEIKTTFPTVKPFTVGAVSQRRARKDNLTTVVFVKDIAAAYLEPYLAGGLHKLNSRALLNPKSIGLDQYGNIPRNRIAALKGQKGVFVGSVKTKSGTVDGVWKRIPAKAKTKNRAASGARLVLLVRFGDALPVKQRLDWPQVARKIVDRTFDKEFGKAMAKAIATAKLK